MNKGCVEERPLSQSPVETLTCASGDKEASSSSRGYNQQCGGHPRISVKNAIQMHLSFAPTPQAFWWQAIFALIGVMASLICTVLIGVRPVDERAFLMKVMTKLCTVIFIPIEARHINGNCFFLMGMAREFVHSGRLIVDGEGRTHVLYIYIYCLGWLLALTVTRAR